MSDLKIGMVTGIYPPKIGGPAQQVSMMAKKLRKDGFHVCVITPHVENLPEFEKRDGVEIYRALTKTPLKSFQLFSKIKSITKTLLNLIKLLASLLNQVAYLYN